MYYYAGEADSSTRYLLNAEKEIDDLYTESVSLKVVSFILNDNVLPYAGEDFEKVMVNAFLALNFARKGMDDDALVEARKVDLKLREYSRQYEGKNKYREDAFIRLITGVLYENGGEVNNAFIAYQKSFETYEVYASNYGTQAPDFLLDDLVRTATNLSFRDETEKYQGLGGRLPENDKQWGGVLVVMCSGKGPIKVQEKKAVTIPDTSGVLHTFQIALPKFEPRYTPGRRYSVSATSDRDSVDATTVPAEDITAIAKAVLEDRLGLIYLKSGGRALLKFLATEKAKKDISKGSDNKARNVLTSLAVDLVVGATEQADTRTWRTLPAEIQLARLHLPAGRYRFLVSSSDGEYVQQSSVEVKPGRTSFVLMDDVR